MKYFLVILVIGWGSVIAQDIPAIQLNIPSVETNTPVDYSLGPCTQITESTDDIGFGTNFTDFVMADGYIVAANDVSNINNLLINIITPEGNNIASADIKIHVDAAGFPGAVLEFFDDLVPADQTVVQTGVTGGDIHQVTFDLSSSSLELEGGATGATYWIALTTTATSGVDNEFWEATSAITNGQAVFSADGGATWIPLVYEGEDHEFVMIVEGNCILSNGGDLSNVNIKVFPNPSTGHVYFQGVPSIDFEVQIQDATGRILSQRRTEQNSLNISDLPTGLYFMSFKVDEVRYSRKIIKE